MRIAPFGVEPWMNEYETRCTYNLGETCVESLTSAQLLALAGYTGARRADRLPMQLTSGASAGRAA